VWADLGCGTGSFTIALAGLLLKKSLVYAVDKNKAALNKMLDEYKDVIIKKIQGDFTEIKLPENLDGILMANSLHYVSDKHAFIKKIQTHLIEQKLFLIVEYDTDIPNQWIPYPVSLNSLKQFTEKKKFIQL
jgi:ubiquinone/menaquinone biosynthesis C-methylase UbiE